MPAPQISLGRVLFLADRQEEASALLRDVFERAWRALGPKAEMTQRAVCTLLDFQEAMGLKKEKEEFRERARQVGCGIFE